MTNAKRIQAQVDATSERIIATVTDGRSESTETFSELLPEHRESLAIDAWRIGLHALRNAQAQAEEARLTEIGKSLKDELTNALAQTVQQHQQQVEAQLRRYLDPKEGELSRRLEQFVEDDGELPRLLSQFTAPDTGVLAQALAAHVGAQSPLVRKLSSSESDGVVQTLKQVCTVAISESQSVFHQALDPLNQGSPVAKFLVSLRDELKRAENSRSEQMTAAFKALDANDPASLLSNLQRHTQETSASLLSAMNPANDNSPLSLMQRTLSELIEQHAKSARELAVEARREQDQRSRDLLEAVVRLDTQKKDARNSIHGGIAFEELVLNAVRSKLSAGPYICTKTGNSPGKVGSSRKGDFVVEFTEDSKWAGAVVVFEAKHVTGWTVANALEELDLARRNREAAVGVYVVAESHAPADFPEFSRVGNSILVRWDWEDPSGHHRLYAAVMLALALATRGRQVQEHASVDAIGEIGNLLGEQLKRVAKIRTASEAIKKNNAAIEKELTSSEVALRDLAEKAQETMRALNLNADDETRDAEEPIKFQSSAGPSSVA